MRALDFISVIAILAALVAAPFLLVGSFTYAFRRRESRVFPIKSTLLFALPVSVGLLGGWTSESIAQDQTLDFLHSVSAKASVSINGHEVQNSDQVLDALRGIRNLLPHHSHPTRKMYVQISDGPRCLPLLVARDSSNSHEYWIFAPSPSKLALRANLEKDIGHVITPVFDQY